MKTFTGISLKNDVKEALEEAIREARAALQTAPTVPVKWTIKKISGSHAGFAGTQLSVTISIQA